MQYCNGCSLFVILSAAALHPLQPACLQVGAEKEKVNAENESAKVEAEKCAAIASEVSEKQASCERDLAAAEPLVQQAEAALDTLNKKDLGETKSLKKPPPGMICWMWQGHRGWGQHNSNSATLCPCCCDYTSGRAKPMLHLQVWMTSRPL